MTDQNQDQALQPQGDAAVVVHSDPAQMIQVVLAATANPDVDAGKMAALYEIAKDMQVEAYRRIYVDVMNDLQANMPPIVNTSKNDQTNSRYAKRDVINAVVVPLYTKAGLSLNFSQGVAEVPGDVRTICTVEHTSGYVREYFVDMPRDDKGPKGSPNKTGVQGVKSSLSYAMRTLTCMIFNIATTDDKDGNTSAPPDPTITPDQITDIENMVQETGRTIPHFLNWAGLERLEDMTETQYKDFMQMLKKTMAEGDQK